MAKNTPPGTEGEFEYDDAIEYIAARDSHREVTRSGKTGNGTTNKPGFEAERVKSADKRLTRNRGFGKSR